MPPSEPELIQPGTVLAGKFRIEQVLGQGGMGVVVAAHHLQLDERVALKFLLPDALSNAEAVARFAREARAAVKIKSEHVARVTDVGTLDNGSPYMVMEYLQGNDLGQLVESQGPFSIADAVEYVLQACEALAEAHALGIVHRDLKPANLFLTRRADGSPSIKVLDFGISKITTGTDSKMNMTRTTTVMGSPLYMSPEQMASAKGVDTRADIWAVGAILHELLTGQVPFNAETMPQLCAKILQEDAPSVREVRPDIPVALEQTVLHCLRKKPDERYPSVADLATDLLPFAPSRARLSVERITKVITAAGLTRSSLSLPPSTSRVATGITQQAWEGAQDQRPSATKWVVAAVALVMLAGGATAAIMGAFRSRPVDAGQDAGVAAASGTALTTATEPTTPPVATEPAPAPAVSLATPDPEPAPSDSADQVKTVAKPPPKFVGSVAKTPQKIIGKTQVGKVSAKTTPPKSNNTDTKSKGKSEQTLPAVDLYQDRK